MLGIGGVEMVVIAVVALLVFGPKEFLGILKGLAGILRFVETTTKDLQGQLQTLVKDTELEDIAKDLQGLTKDITNRQTFEVGQFVELPKHGLPEYIENSPEKNAKTNRAKEDEV